MHNLLYPVRIKGVTMRYKYRQREGGYCANCSC